MRQNRRQLRLVLWASSLISAFVLILLLSTKITSNYTPTLTQPAVGAILPTAPPEISPIPLEVVITPTPMPLIVPTIVINAPPTKPAVVAQPQPLTASPLILIRLRPTNSKVIVEQLGNLEAVQAGRIQPIDYLPAKNGQPERLLLVISKVDESFFANSGLEYSLLDDDADTARYYAVSLSDSQPSQAESWLDEQHARILEQVGNRVIIKAELPYYVGFGALSKLPIDKLPPRIHLPGLTATCPCPTLAAATFATAPIATTKVAKELKEQLSELKEESLERIVTQIAQNEVRGKGALNTRYAAASGSVYMAERLYTYFFALGLKVEYDSFLEGAFGTISTNVIAEQIGENKVWANEPILLVAHYDSIGERNLKGVSNSKIPAYGANDNGVGIAGLIEISRLLTPYRLQRPVRYIAFGSEEQGMLGSQHYAYNHLKQTRLNAVINLDSFGYNPGTEDWVILNYDHNGTNLKDAFLSYATKYEINLRLDARRGAAFFRSDDFYFSELGYSAIALTDSFNLQSPNNHTPNDTVANVNFTTTRKVIQLALVAVIEKAILVSGS